MLRKLFNRLQSATLEIDNLESLAERHADGLSDCQTDRNKIASYLDFLIADIQTTQKSEQALINSISWFTSTASAVYLDQDEETLEMIVRAINRVMALLPASRKDEVFRQHVLPNLCGEKAQNELNMRVYADRASKILLYAGYKDYKDEDFEFKTTGPSNSFLLTLFKRPDGDNVPFVYNGDRFFRGTSLTPQLFP